MSKLVIDRIESLPTDAAFVVVYTESCPDPDQASQLAHAITERSTSKSGVSVLFLPSDSDIKTLPNLEDLESIGLCGKHERDTLLAQRNWLLADLEAAADILRKYETLHKAKGTDDGFEKAKVNGDLAMRFESTMAAVRGGSLQ